MFLTLIGYNSDMNVRKILILLVLGVFLWSAPITIASGELTTQSGTNPGQVVIKEENGVRYLSTETNPGETVVVESTASAVAPQNSFLRLPEGFFTDFTNLFNRLLRIVLAVAALLTFAFLIWGAFKWITSGGDKGKTEDARSTMISAVIGLIIVAASYAILSLVLNLLGFSSLNDVLNNATGDSSTDIIIVTSPSPSPSPAPTPSP